MRFTALDSLRGISALLVVVFHFSAQTHFQNVEFIRGGYLFVDFFFVLSGFVIAHAYGNKLHSISDMYLFVVRRFGRVWPLHMAVLFLYLCLGIAKIGAIYLGVSSVTTSIPWAPHDTLASFFINVCLLHSMGLLPALTWNDASWSISAEFWAYIVFALMALFCQARLLFCAIIMAAMAALYLCLRSNTYMNATYDLGFVRCLYGFFVGVIVHSIWKVSHKVSPNKAHFWELASAIGIIEFVAMAHGSAFSFLAPLVFAQGVFFFAHAQGFISKLLELRVSAYLGKLSYSIYMMQFIVLGVAGLMVSRAGKVLHGHASPVIAAYLDQFFADPYIQDGVCIVRLLAVVAFASLSFRWVEDPCRRFFNDFAAAQKR